MRPKGGRPRTFPLGVVPLALVERERTGRTWVEIARDLKVSPGTLRARISDLRRETGAHKTPAKGLEAHCP
jgi:DNA-binding NarL/FixJ family response regulator